MYWKDEGYLLSKNNFNENSIIIETFTLEHGKYIGIVYGGSSRKQKRNFQVGNKILLNWKSKNENRTGYFNVELIKAISPLFFDDKKKTVCIKVSPDFASFRAECESTSTHQHSNAFRSIEQGSYDLGLRFFAN